MSDEGVDVREEQGNGGFEQRLGGGLLVEEREIEGKELSVG